MEPKAVAKQSCWKRRTTLEKALICFSCLCILLALVAIVIASLFGSFHQCEVQTCLSQECVQTASRMMQALDTKVDPCEDFFEFACGSWNRMYTIPSDRPNYSSFKKLDDDLQESLRELLDMPVSKSESKAIQKAKRFYRSCLNTTAIEDAGVTPLMRLMDELGGWPLLKPPPSTHQPLHLSTQLAKLKLINHATLINSWVMPDEKNSDLNVIAIDQGHLGMPTRDYFLRSTDNKSLIAYQTMAVRVALILGAPEASVETDIKDMIDFEIKLANITTPEEQRRDRDLTYSMFSLANLTSQFGKEPIDWDIYLNGIFSSVNITLQPNTRIVVYASSYIADLKTLINNTPQRTIINYLMWHYVASRIVLLPQKYLDIKKDFNKVMQGTEHERVRWRTCVTYVNEIFGLIVGRMYVEKNFDHKAKESALNMIRQLREAFKQQLSQVTWLKEETKKVAQEKADAIQEKIGFPDYIFNDTYLENEVEEMELAADQYFNNVLNIQRVTIKNNYKQLNQKVDKERWSTPPAMVNAFYSTSRNHIIFPAGILHPPFYHEKYPMSLNFGGIGMVIGHEITHGFDDKGRMFDKAGNIREWWDAEDSQNFKDKAQCFIHQYSNYTIPEINMNINGKQTQGENIADNGGLKQAFQAYQHWVKINGPEHPLPGLNMTSNQQFFLSFAQIWCGTSRPESSIQNIRASRHSPGNIRVLGTLSNSLDFSTAFNCPLGSRMNPTHKCQIW